MLKDRLKGMVGKSVRFVMTAQTINRALIVKEVYDDYVELHDYDRDTYYDVQLSHIVAIQHEDHDHDFRH